MRILSPAILIIFLTLNACTSSKKTADGKILVKENGEARLGKSPLSLILPQELEMYQVHGKEGYSGFNIFSKNNKDDIKAEIVIWSGHPILYASEEPKEKIDSSYSTMLDKKILWTIYKTGTGLLATSKSEYGFFIWTKERNDVDRMITVFSTLKKK